MSNTSLKIVNLPKLKDDGSNWITYKERVMNTLTHKGLKRHVIGNARKPIEIELRDDGEYYLPKSMVPLSDDKIEEYETKTDEYAQKQASVREVIYETVSKSTFLQIKNEADASLLWKKLSSIFEGKGDMVQADMLTRLHNMMCAEDGDVRTHISDMVEIREELAGMGAPLTDAQFAANIRKSLPSNYRPLLTSISTAARLAKTLFTSDMLIQAVLEEADHQIVAKNTEKAVENAAMLAATNLKSSKGRNKQRKTRNGQHCNNCDRDGHIAADCYSKGGGKEGQQPWKKKQKDGTAATATNNDDMDVDVALLSANIEDEEENVALAVTSDFHQEAKALSVSSPSHNGIIIDSGASRHFSPELSKYTKFVKIPHAPIKAADGRIFNAMGRGEMKLYFPMGPNERPTLVTLKNVYYAPSMAFTLISVSCIDRAGFALHIENCICSISTPTSRIIGRIPLIRGLYRVPQGPMLPPRSHVATLATRLMSITELHQKMGHINHEDLRCMVRDRTVTGIELDPDSKPEFCSTCVQAKAARKPFPKKSSTERATRYGEKVVSDLWGPSPVKSMGGKYYSICFQDESTHEEKIYFTVKKSEAFDYYKKYEAWVKVQRKARIETLGTDRGGEFTSEEFNTHLENAGTVRHLTVHDSPPSNGASERGNRTHMESTRAMLIASGLPKYLWAETKRHAVWLRNRTSTKALPHGKTPYEMATGQKPDLSDLREWGCTAWIKRLHTNKLAPRAEEGRFVGYDTESKGYRIYWPNKKSVSVERDVYFNKDEILSPGTVQIEGETDFLTPPSSQVSKTQNVTLQTPEDVINDSEPQNEATHPENDALAPPEPPPAQPNAPNTIPFPPATPNPPPKRVRDDGLIPPEPGTGRGHRARQPEGFYKALNDRKITGTALEASAAAIVDDDELLEQGGVEIDDDVGGWQADWEDMALFAGNEPNTLNEALGRVAESRVWLDATEAELAQIEKLDTWDIVEAPTDANVVQSRYVFRYKRDAAGTVVKHKVRLVAKGYTQVYGIDYHDTFAPVVKHTTLRVLLSMAAQRGSIIHQADVKNAYLNAELKETIYMELPPQYSRFRSLTKKAKTFHRPVCKLKKSLYGTKQGAREWYQKIRGVFSAFGYSISAADEAVFFKIQGEHYTIVAAATDDFTIVANSIDAVQLIKTQLNDQFELVDLGEISWLLGISITRDLNAHTISLGQQAYIDHILTRMKLAGAKPVATPLEPGIDLNLDSPAVSIQSLSPSEKAEYREGIGSLMYVCVGSRPDISYAVTTLSRFVESPRSTHLIAMRRVFRYLKATRDLRLVLGGDNCDLIGYSDADWASQMDRHSISGYAFYIGNGAVSWSSKKQPIVTLSSTESEYVALTHAAKELIWLRKLITEIIQPILSPSSLLCDNQGAISLSKDATFHARTKHIDTRFHFIRQTVDLQITSLTYCPTDDMVADIFTKSLARPKLEKFRHLLGLR
jgi:hypothetical protein